MNVHMSNMLSVCCSPHGAPEFVSIRRYWLLRATKSQKDFSRQGFHAVGNRSNQCEHGSWHEVMPSVQKHWYWREATSIIYFVRPSALQVIFPYVYLQCDSLFAERLLLHRACNECVHLITALTSISCLSINLSIDYISYLVKKLITTATKKLHMPYRHFFPFDFGLIFAILRRFLPLCVVSNPSTMASSCQDADFFSRFAINR